MSVTVSVVAKKAVTALLTSKKGRRFLLYAIGIILFVVLAPVVVILYMLSWTSNPQLFDPSSIQGWIGQDAVSQEIANVFTLQGKEADILRAQVLYVCYLKDQVEISETFVEDLSGCFPEPPESDEALLEKVEQIFQVQIEKEDFQMVMHFITSPLSSQPEPSGSG